jgi:hypothetical protein
MNKFQIAGIGVISCVGLAMGLTWLFNILHRLGVLQ